MGPRLGVIAWRNLWRHRRRTLLTLSSISFGVFFAVLVTAVQDHQWREMIDLAARLGGGHVTLQHPDYLESPTLAHTVHAERVLRAARSDPHVQRSVARITGQVMLSTAERSYGAGFIAYDPEVESAETLSLLEAVGDGAALDAGAEERGILLGRRLADNLNARLGRKVVFTLTDKQGEVVRDVARVAGYIETGAASVDGRLALLPLARMRQVLGYEADEAVQVALFLDDQRRAGEVAARLSPRIAADAAALAWQEAQPDLAAFIAMKVVGARFMEIVIALLVAAGIFNTLFVSVMERVREFGIMLAVGYSPVALFRMVMFESLWLGLLGLVGGALLTAGPYYYLWRHGFDALAAAGLSGSEVAGVAVSGLMRADIYPEHAVQIAVAALLAVVAAGVYPAVQAGRVEPVESIRLV